jgi:hypothetical protein
VADQPQATIKQRDLYGALLDELVPDGASPDNNGFVQLSGNPKEHQFQTESVRGISRSALRKTLLTLKHGRVYTDRREGNTYSWWIKLPQQIGSLGSQRVTVSTPPDFLKGAYQALLAQVTESTPKENGYAVLRENPIQAVADATGLKYSSARNYVRLLKDWLLYETGRDDVGKYWLVRLPEETQPAHDEADAAESEGEPVSDGASSVAEHKPTWYFPLLQTIDDQMDALAAMRQDVVRKTDIAIATLAAIRGEMETVRSEQGILKLIDYEREQRIKQLEAERDTAKAELESARQQVERLKQNRKEVRQSTETIAAILAED